MSKHTIFKFCLYIAVLIGFGYALPATAHQEEWLATYETMRCGGEYVSRYEAWVKDLQCEAFIKQPVPADQQIGAGITPQDIENAFPDAGDYHYLVFSSYRDGNWEIYGFENPWHDMSIQYPIRMTSLDTSELRPVLRPGSTQIAFASYQTGNYEVYLMDWGGGDWQQLTWNEGYDSQAAWSPDGSKIVLVNELDGNLEIGVMNADGTGWTRLTSDAADDFNPSWSPDGTQIVWVKAYDNYNGVIYTMNADGTNVQALTTPLLYAENPTWSKDGSTIAFDYDMNFDYFTDLVRMNADGTNLTLIKGGSYMVDYLVGTWTEVEENELLFTQISYIEYQGNLYITDMCVGAISSSSEDGHCYSASELDSYPNAAPQDITIPETQVLPLPKYTRSGDFDIYVFGSDPGPASIYLMDLECTDDDWMWNSCGGWQADGLQSTTYRGVPNITLYFRSWGWDLANHREAYPASGFDTYTHVYAWELKGEVRDSRDNGLANVSVVTDPVFEDQKNTDFYGRFHRYVPYIDVFVNLNKTGYGVLPHIALDNQDYYDGIDLQEFWVLPPKDDLITNGNFESTLDGWTLSGDDEASLYVPGHTGDNSVYLAYYPRSEGDKATTDAGLASQLVDQKAPQVYRTSISQVVDIPSAMHKPTLSFFAFPYGSNPVNKFNVLVNDTAIYTATEATEGFEHVWLDMTEWQGQAVTLTFTVINESLVSPRSILLDEISLGAWETPLVTDVTPTRYEEWETMIITIAGDNFIETPVVHIGGVKVINVTWLDEKTLQAEIPSGMAPGVYEVWVTNPGGQSNAWTGQIHVGELRFIPYLVK